MLDILRFLSIFCTGIAAGTWVVTQLATVQTLKELSEASAIHLLQATEKRIVRFNPLCTVTSVLAGALILMFRLSPTDTDTFFTGLGCAAATGATLISSAWNMPLRRKITVAMDGSPLGYSRMQQQWDRGNCARTVLGLVAFASYVLAAL